jgi:hypothetical protein
MKRKRRSVRALKKKQSELKTVWDLVRKPVPPGERAHTDKNLYNRKKLKQKLHRDSEWLLFV